MLNVYYYALFASVLFVLLSPGVIVTIPKSGSSNCSMWFELMKSKGTSGCATSLISVLVHALVFGLVFAGFIFYAQHKL